LNSLILLSLVVPVYNEEKSLPALFAALEEACAKTLRECEPIEIVLVNDGSTDLSWKLISDQCQRKPAWVGLNLSRNFGHQLALAAGLETARGHAVVSLDADLQDPPEVILAMVAEHRRGYDVVYATRRHRGEEPFLKRITAGMFYALMEKICGMPMLRNTGDFRLISRRALTELSRLRETHRFLRGLVPWIGFPQTQVFYDRSDRRHGTTNYPFRKMLALAVDGIASMSAAPLRLAYVLSLALFSVFIGYVLYVIIKHFALGSELVHGWSSIMAAITIFGTIQLLQLGIFGEYLGRIYEQTKNRPLFIVQDIVRCETLPSSTCSTSSKN
jgi:glycosyltransferase involved in cell wall biosynthesis